jgi:hypothetical protein
MIVPLKDVMHQKFASSKKTQPQPLARPEKNWVCGLSIYRHPNKQGTSLASTNAQTGFGR